MQTEDAKAISFADLEFKDRDRLTGVAARVFFPNGYGASVIRGPFTYGGDLGLYELGVLDGSHGDCRLTYDTPITEDVEGHLSEADVTRLLQAIAALPAKQAAQ